MKTKKRKLFRFISSLFLILPCMLQAQPALNDSTFNTFDTDQFRNQKGADGLVTISLLQPDNKLLIGGYFTAYNGKPANQIARIKENGKPDMSFQTGEGANDAIRALAVQPDKRIIVAGHFTQYNGQEVAYITRLNGSGSLDKHFKTGTGTNGFVSHVLLQPDGKIIAGGNFTEYNGVPARGLIRLNKSGSRDLTFKPLDSTLQIVGMLLQADGKIIIGFRHEERLQLIRLNKNGSRDHSFIPGIDLNDPFQYRLDAMVLQADGKLLIAGRKGPWERDAFLLRLNTNGEPDQAFDFRAPESERVWIYSLALQPDGKIIVGGKVNTIDGRKSINYVGRLYANGEKDVTFANENLAGENMLVHTAAVQADGKIIIGGLFADKYTCCMNNLGRLNSDGSTDISYNKTTGANGTVRTVTAQPNGKIIIGGDFSMFNYTGRSHIARLKEDGSVDHHFDPGTGADGSIYSTVLQPDGSILLGGEFTTFNGVSRKGIARIRSNGSLDETFNPGTGISGTVYAIAIQPDGRILLAGSFTAYNGNQRRGIVRLHSDGSLDAQFHSLESGSIYSCLLQPDGKILVGGSFYTTGSGFSCENIMRLNSDGSPDTGFNSSGARTVYTMALQADGKIVAGGGYESSRQYFVGFVCRVNADGSMDDTFIPSETGGMGGTEDYVRSVVLQDDNKILICGQFTSYSNTSMNRIGRLNSDGSVDMNFNAEAGGSIFAAARVPGGKMIIAGDFTSYQGVPRNGIARIISSNGNSLIADSKTIADPHRVHGAAFPRLYPNPVAHTLTIDNLPAGSTLSIKNIAGELLYNEVVGNDKARIEVSGYSNGIYFLTSEYQGNSSNTRFVISR